MVASDNLTPSQRIRSTSYASFNVLSLSLIIGIGLLTILTSYILVPTISYVHETCKLTTSYSDMEWSTNETLQLQRLAHEEDNGEDGIWTNATDAIPITRSPNHVLGTLDATDPSHPRLARPRKEDAKLERLFTGFSDKTRVGEAVVAEKEGGWNS